MQLRSKHYIPIYFWLVIIATTTLGTEISDMLDRTFHLGYTFGSLLLFVCLMATLWRWYNRFGDLQVHPITDRTKVIYYWVAILFSNSLGTAFGDFLGDVAGLSYLTGAAVTAGIILIVMLIHKFTDLNRMLLFWIAFIFTRPLGATIGDFLTKPLAKGGLDLGTLNASRVSIVLMVGMILIAHQRSVKPAVDRPLHQCQRLLQVRDQTIRIFYTNV